MSTKYAIRILPPDATSNGMFRVVAEIQSTAVLATQHETFVLGEGYTEEAAREQSQRFLAQMIVNVHRTEVAR